MVSREREIKIKILGDSSGAEKAFKQVGDKADGLGTRLKNSFGPALLAGAGVALAGFGKGALEAASESQKVAAQTDAVIKSTGAAAGVSSNHISDLAGKLQKLSGVEDEAIQSGANMLLTFTNVKNAAGEGNDVFDQAATTALDMSVAMGTDAKSAAMQLGKALNDPIKGVGALARVGVTFTDQQKEQIKALVESGDTMGAQRIILAELNKEFGGSAKAAGDAQSPMDKLRLTFGEMQEKIGTALLPVITQLAEKIAGLIDWFSNLGPGVKTAMAIFAGLVTTFLLVTKALQLAQAGAALFGVTLNVSLGPIALVITAIAAVGVGLVLLYQKSETFRDIVQGVFSAVSTAAGAMKDFILGVFRGIVDTWLGAVEWIIRGAANAFGWVPGIGPKLKEAARAIEGFRDDANRALGGIKDKEVSIKLLTKGLPADPFGSYLSAVPAGVPHRNRRAHGGPVTAGDTYLVGEEGPELLVTGTNGTVIPNGGLAAFGGPSVVHNHYEIHAPNYVGSKEDLVRTLEEAVTRKARNGDPLWAPLAAR